MNWKAVDLPFDWQTSCPRPGVTLLENCPGNRVKCLNRRWAEDIHDDTPE